MGNSGGGGGDDGDGGGSGGNRLRGRGRGKTNRTAPYNNQTKGKRKCGICGQEGRSFCFITGTVFSVNLFL